jgi:hypothetical protein
VRLGRFSVFIALTVVLASLLAPWRTPTAVAAGCSYSTIPDPHERLARAIEGWSDLVVVGVVTKEMRVEVDYDTPDPTDLKTSREKTKPDEFTLFRSTIRPEAVLKGDLPPGDLEMTWLTEVWQCVSSPRMYEGERLLLFLKQWPTYTVNSEPRGHIWLASLFGGVVQLKQGDALMKDYQSRKTPQYLASAADLIRSVSAQLGSSPEATNSAIAAARSPEPQIDKRTSADSPPWTALAGGALAVAIALAAMWVHRRT